MEIDNEVPDPPSMENISEENAFEPISVAVDEIAFDHSLRDEYDSGDGDLEIICDGDNRIICHSCIVECQSRIMRRSIVRKSQDGRLLPRAQLSCPKFSIFQMRKLLGIMYPSQHAVFNSLNEMIEILIVAAFYDISWIVKSVEKAMLDLLPEGENGDQLRDQKVAQATRCRDILLVLQENVQFSDENPNPNYKPFDTAFESITTTLLAKLATFANEGVIPEPSDPVSITNLVASQLEDDNPGREIDQSESLMIFLTYCFKESFERDPNQNLSNKIFHEVVSRNSVLQQTLVNLIPEIVRNRPAAPPVAQVVPPPPVIPPRANDELPFHDGPMNRFRRARELRRFPRGPGWGFGHGALDGPDGPPGNDDPNNPPPGPGPGRPGVRVGRRNVIAAHPGLRFPPGYILDPVIEPNQGVPIAGAPINVAGDGNQHQDRLERQMARARQRLQARAESLDRLRQRQRELLNPLGLVNPAEMKTRRQNEMKKWSDENRSKYTSKVESIETMKDKESASKVRLQAEKTLEKLKIALKSINKSAKYFETKEFRELIEPYLKLQSRLQSVVNSLDFNALDKELPFSKQKTATETSSDRETQIKADRELALSMVRSLNQDHPNGSEQNVNSTRFQFAWADIDKTQREARIKKLQERVRREQTPSIIETENGRVGLLDLSGPISKKRKLSGDKQQSRENKVKNWLEKQRNEQESVDIVPIADIVPATKSKSLDKAKTTESNADVKTDPGEEPSLSVLADAAMEAMRTAAAQNTANNTVKIEVDDSQPIVVDPSDEDDVILSDLYPANIEPGPSGLNSKSRKKKK